MNIATCGKIYTRTVLFKGCTVYVCNDHGGIIVSENTMLTHPYFEKLRNIDLSKFKLENGDYCFEQDCNASVVLAFIPRDVLKNHYFYCKTEEGYQKFYDQCLVILKHFNPEIHNIVTAQN